MGASKQENGSRVVLPLARHQYSIHCESSRVAQDASKRRWAPHTISGTPKVETEYATNESELNCYFNQVAIKIIYANRGLHHMHHLLDDLPTEIRIMSQEFGHPSVVNL